MRKVTVDQPSSPQLNQGSPQLNTDVLNVLFGAL